MTVVRIDPPSSPGFVVRAEQDMGSTYAVVEQDGSVREVEVHRPGVPWDRPPGPGAAPTSAEQTAAIAGRVRPV